MWMSGLRILILPQALNITLALGALSLASQCAIPFYPIPLTLQTLAVMAVAFSLPPGQATLSVLAWVTSGAVGIPVFSGCCGGPGVLCGPRGGYLWGMLIASYVMSWVRFKVGPMLGRAKKESEERSLRLPFWLFLGTALLGNSVILGLGWMQLQFLLDSRYHAWLVGVLPFIIGEAFKVLMVSGVFYYFQNAFYRESSPH